MLFEGAQKLRDAQYFSLQVYSVGMCVIGHEIITRHVCGTIGTLQFLPGLLHSTSRQSLEVDFCSLAVPLVVAGTAVAATRMDETL